MFSLKLITILSFQVSSLFSLQFHGIGAKYLSERHRLKTLHLNLSTTKECWIEQRLDHFDNKEERTWKMRYFQKMDFWKPGSPIILFIGGEGWADPSDLELVFLNDLAKLINGAVIGSEHRYYGKSIPLPKVNRTDDLKYLSSEQALFDLAHLIRHFKKQIDSPNSKVVVVGGSYAGNLAAWMRLKYPNLVDAALASSAPVFAKKNFIECMQKVSNDFKKYGGDDCFNKIQQKFNRYKELFKSNSGIEQLKKEENICPDSDMTRIENQELFISDKYSYLTAEAQYGGPDNIKYQCLRLITEIKDTPCDPIDFNKTCRGLDQWTYQTCTEFGYFQTSCPPFTDLVSVDFYVKMCETTFGSDFNEKRVDQGIARTNEMYGGQNPKLSRVVFTNGDVDPWSTLGILKSLSPDVPAIVIPDETHCSELHSDSPQSAKARKDAITMIMKWLQL